MVNTKTASYFREQPDLPIQLEYNSRSLYNGAFGFGWSSELEKKLLYDKNDFLQNIKIGSKELKFKIIDKHIVSIQVDNNTYKFAYQGNQLIQVSTPLRTWKYEYSSFDNLTKVLVNNRLEEKIDYDESKDQVLAVEDRVLNCKSFYNYESVASLHSLTLHSTEQQNCKSMNRKTLYTYEFSKDDHGQLFLVKESQNNDNNYGELK